LPFSEPQGQVAKRHARSVLRETPEIVADLDPAEQRRLAVALENEAARRQRDREQIAKEKEREELGPETVADLEFKEELQSTEYLLIQARGHVRGFLQHAKEIGLDDTPSDWRESCMTWLDDLRGHIEMAQAFLHGNEIDWAPFEELLSREGS
jgi:hypothetical protein